MPKIIPTNEAVREFKGLVPTLTHDGEVRIESAGIIMYLDEIQPRPRRTLADITWARVVADRHGFQQAVVDWFNGPSEARTATIGGPCD